MGRAWTPAELNLVDAAAELEIRPGTARRWTPIWVVCVEPEVYVRTWYRRDAGWFGRALSAGRARIRVPGLEAEVVVHDLGGSLRLAVDAAYRAKYGGPGARSMVTDEAAATTLRLNRTGPVPAEN